MDLVVFTSANGSRASIAAAFFNALVVPSLAVAVPAVPDPVAKLDGEFLAAARELSDQFTVVPPSRFTSQLGAKASLIVYVGCAVSLLKVDGVPYLEWDIAHTKVGPKEATHVARDSILRSVEGLLRRRGWLRQEQARSGR
jgi:hypothetical protein